MRFFPDIAGWLRSDQDDSDSSAASTNATYAPGPVYEASLAMTAAAWVAHGVAQAVPRSRSAELEAILLRPMPKYGWTGLARRVVSSYLLTGTGFVRIVNTSAGRPERLQHIKTKKVIDPFTPAGSFTYMSARGTVEIPIEDMIIFAYDDSDASPWRGTSPLAGLENITYVDETAFEKVGAALFHAKFGNMFSPRPDDWSRVSPVLDKDQRRELRDELAAALGGQNGGGNFLGSVPMTVDQLMPMFRNLALTAEHNLAEERVCSALRIHPSVMGLGTGNQQVRVGATARENRIESWYSGVQPVILGLAEVLTRQLGFLYGADVELDTSNIRELKRTDEEIIELVEAGLITPDEGRAMAGIDGPAPAPSAEPEDDPGDE